LYSSEPLQLLFQADGKTARAALASALLLGGMDDLCAYAYEVCRGAISAETLEDWLHFLETIPSGSDAEMNQSMFGPFARRLRDDIFTYLIVTLPQILQVTSSAQNGQTQSEPQPVGDSGWNALLNVYSRLPFELFKDAVESPAFPISENHQTHSYEGYVYWANSSQHIALHSLGSSAFQVCEGGDSVEKATRDLARRGR
jgi:hypothetical protein